MEPTDERRHAAERLHMLEAVLMAIERRADLLDLVGSCGSAEEAHERLQHDWGLTDVQAYAALDLQVRRFAERERARIADERGELTRRLTELGA